MVEVLGRRRAVTSAMTEGLSLPQPPKISIANSVFTLVDRAGNEMQCNLVDPNVGRYLDVVIVGANPNKSKIFYEGEWTPQTTEPPVCVSDNGIAPSVNSITPQSPTCAQCQWNVIGSDVSKRTGKGIKACQDRKKVACYVIGDASGELYQFQVTPAALKGLAAYGKWVAGHPSASGQGAADVSEIVTRLYFAAGEQGVIAFGAVGGIDAAMDQRIEAAYERGQIAEIIGTNDVPISGLLAAPQQQQQLAAPAPQSFAPAPQQFNVAQPVQHAAPPGHEWSAVANRWIPVNAAGQPTGGPTLVQQAPPHTPAPHVQQAMAAIPQTPPPPPTPVWDAATQSWVLPQPQAPQNQYPAPAPGSDPYAVPAFLDRKGNGPAGAPGGNGAAPGVQHTQQPQQAFSAPGQAPGGVTMAGPAPAPSKRGGKRANAGRPPAQPQNFAPQGQVQDAQPAQFVQQPVAPFAGQQPQGQQHPQPAPQQQFGMAPAGPPPVDMTAALERAFATPVPAR